MRSIWSGAVTLSLINMPVKLGSGVKQDYLGLHMVRKTDGSRIKYKYVGAADGEPVEWQDVARGYEAPDGSMVILDDQDFEKAYGAKNRVAEITQFARPEDIPAMAVNKSYWVQPATGGEKTYALLAHVLEEAHKVAIVTFAMRERQSVAVLRAEGGYLSLETLNWDTELIRPDFAAPPMTSSPEEQQLARTLVRDMTKPYDHQAQVDVSAEALHAVIQAKIETHQVIPAPARPKSDEATPTQDLAAALKASVDAHKPKSRQRKPRSA